MNIDQAREEILESIAARFTSELRAGGHPDIERYQQEYPELAEEIESILSPIFLIEQIKASPGPGLATGSPLDRIADLKEVDSYRILGELGRGGMGVVLCAEHRTLGRKVAIKVLPIPKIDPSNTVERFRREAQAAARLHHTNIVSVFGVGQGDGFYYYVMDLVEGRSLSEAIGDWRTQPQRDPCTHYRWLAGLVASLADALSYAHSNGILHRDLKPSNVLLDHRGTIWITDFGLAKDQACTAHLTHVGDVVGTPQYLPPESLDGQYDARSEVYGLGLILYELLTLEPAYPNGSPAELLRVIARQSPAPVRSRKRDIPRDLATIVDKCLSRNPADRYQTMEALKRDLSAFIEGRPLKARRPTLPEVAGRWAKRNPLSAALAGVSLSLMALVAIGASWGYWTVSRALHQEARIAQSLRDQQRATEEARRLAEKNLTLLEAQHHRAESNLTLSMEAFDQMFKVIVGRGRSVEMETDIDGYRELSGIETALTDGDAEFLDRMVRFYEQFAALNSENERLILEAAKAYRRVGNIYQLVGKMAPAIEAYEKSLELLPDSQNDAKGDKALLLTRVRTRNEMSNALRRMGAPIKAQQSYLASIRDLESSPLRSTDPEIRLELARTMAALGWNMMRAWSPNPLHGPEKPARGGSPRFAWEEPRRDRPIPLPPLPPAATRSRSEGPDRAGRILDRQNKPLNRQAIEILDQLIDEDPDNLEAIAVRATCYWNLALATIDDDRRQGVEYRSQAIEALQDLWTKRPEHTETQYLLALACSLVADPRDPAELDMLQRGSQIAQRLAERSPSMLDYHLLYVNLLAKQASLHLNQGDRELALVALQSARNSLDTLLTSNTTDRSLSWTIGLVTRELQLLAREFRHAGNSRQANEISQYLAQLRAYRKSESRTDSELLEDYNRSRR